LLHGGFVHLLFNCMFLLICGRAVEPILARRTLSAVRDRRLCGRGGAVGAAPETQVPMIGASGAVSAVIGAYAMLFGRQKLRVANPTLGLWLNALWLGAAWVGFSC
jgi:membrane associated rhomboid family serine protease